jgi:tetratricopeptide (TPR) repeat protein
MKLVSGLFLLATSAATLLFTGCAGGPLLAEKPKEDRAARERSHVYMEGVSANSVAMTSHSGVTCSLPVGSDHLGSSGKSLAPSKEWRELADRASACAAEKNWKTMDSLGALMSKTDVDSPWGAYYLSLAAEGKGDYARSFWMVELAQKKAGTEVGIFSYEKARLYLKLKDTKLAINEMLKALSHDSHLADGHLFLAEIYHRDLEYDRAESRYQAALDVDPEKYDALVGLGKLKIETEHPADAMALFKRALDVRPSNDLRAEIKVLEGKIARVPAQAHAPAEPIVEKNDQKKDRSAK